MANKPEKFIDENGLRLDGRAVDEIRPMTIEIGVLSRADGSCLFRMGKNKILAAVYGPRELHPRRMQKPDEAIVRYRYNMAAFSVEDRARPGPSRRSIEISKVSRDAFCSHNHDKVLPKCSYRCVCRSASSRCRYTDSSNQCCIYCTCRQVFQ